MLTSEQIEPLHGQTLSSTDDGQAQPRAIGKSAICVGVSDTGRTALLDLFQQGSSKISLPRQRSKSKEVILINTAGGVTGGDAFDTHIEVRPNASLTVTTQAAERAYRAARREVGHIRTEIKVCENACLHWLPQELILFNNSAVKRQLIVDLEQTATLLLVEPIVFGRTTMNEALDQVHFSDSIAISRAGVPLYFDRLHLSDNAMAHLNRRSTANGARAMASIVYVHEGAENQLDDIRSRLPETAGASMVAQNTMVIRHLAADGFELRRDIIPILERLAGQHLPTSWRL